MENFIKIGIWMFIFSITVSGQPVGSSNYLQQRQQSINLMRGSVKCENDSLLYTPENVKPECITAALDCFMRELNGTVRQECQDDEDHVGPAIHYLKQGIDMLRKNKKDLSDHSECPCEGWPEASFSTFLDKYQTLLEIESSL